MNPLGGCSPAIQFSNAFLICLFCKIDCHEVGACQPQIFTICFMWWFCLWEKKSSIKFLPKRWNSFPHSNVLHVLGRNWRFQEIHPKFSNRPLQLGISTNGEQIKRPDAAQIDICEVNPKTMMFMLNIKAFSIFKLIVVNRFAVIVEKLALMVDRFPDLLKSQASNSESGILRTEPFLKLSLHILKQNPSLKISCPVKWGECFLTKFDRR